MKIQTYFIAPNETDTNIRSSDYSNMVVLDQEKPPGVLLVFLGGSNSYERCSQRPLFEQSLKNGYHIIALDYQYERPANANCWRSNDDECYERNRAAKTFGIQGVEGLHCAGGMH